MKIIEIYILKKLIFNFFSFFTKKMIDKTAINANPHVFVIVSPDNSLRLSNVSKPK